MNKIRNKNGEITTDNTEIQRIIRDYYQQLYANKMDNVEEMHKFLEKYNFPKQPERNKSEQTHHKHGNQICNQKSSSKQSPRTRQLHSWILPKIWRRANTYSTKLSQKSAVAAKSLQSCPTLCDPIDGSQPGSPSLGFSGQEQWSGLPFPSPMHESEKWKWSRSVVSDSLRPHGLRPTRLLHPWDFPGKTAGVGCHCRKVQRKVNCQTHSMRPPSPQYQNLTKVSQKKKTTGQYHWWT